MWIVTGFVAQENQSWELFPINDAPQQTSKSLIWHVLPELNWDIIMLHFLMSSICIRWVILSFISGQQIY